MQIYARFFKIFCDFIQKYTHAWEKEELSGLATFSKGQGYSKSDLVDKGQPIILYGRLYTKYETLISEVDTFITDNSKAIISKGNEVLVPASGETSEDISRASVVASKDIVIGGDLNIIYPNERINSIFLALNISNGSQQKEMIKRAQGKSVVHLHNSDLRKIKLTFPSLYEQTKIGQLFQVLDNLLALHQRKCNMLKELKKGYLQQMFPKEDKKIPEIRFRDFNGEWENKKLRELLKERNDQISENEDYLLMSFVAYHGVVPKGERYDRSALVLTDSKKYKKTELGDFIYSSNNLETGSIGFNNTGSALISPVYSIFYSTKDADSRFIGLMVSQKYFIYQMIRFRQGVVYGQYRIHESDFLTIIVNIPSKKEQLKIIDFFMNLDQQITQQESKLKHLKQLKQAYLQNMFV